MVKIATEYLGDLHCKVTHTPSGTFFLTDAPLDNNGKAEFISPTDLLAASIGSCIATIMGIKANAENIDLKGMKIDVVKHMTNIPIRKVAKLEIDITFPGKLNDREFKIMENVVKTCPVSRSLKDDIEFVVVYNFADETGGNE